ncbi:MAG: flagellar basal body L-ring protein FlgH, partial [Fibrobacterota bacterium]
MRQASYLAICLVFGGLDAEAAPTALSRDFSLLGDHKSRRVDDVVTVMVGESNTAKNTAQTSTLSQSKA